MDEFTFRQVRQIAQFPLATSLAGGELAFVQAGGLGGPYRSIAVDDLVGWGLASGGTLRLAAGEAIAWNGTLPQPVTLRAGPLGFSLSAPVSVQGNLDALGVSIAGVPVATHNWVQQSLDYLLVNSVSSFNGRTGAVELLTADILRAGGAPADNPVFTGRVVGPTNWNPALCDNTLVTSAWVQSALGAGLCAFAGSPYFYGSPTASTPPAGDYSLRVANTMWVTDEINTLLDSPELVGIMTAGVSSFNGRAGVVTLTAADITAAGGALLASPAFTGIPTAPTPASSDNSGTLATTAFVHSYVGTLMGGPSNANPTMAGVAAPGVSLLYARGDHVHPIDTSRVAKSGDVMTGILEINPSTGASSCQVKSNDNNAVLYLDKAGTGFQSAIYGRAGASSTRWAMVFGDNFAESGSNAGSNFELYRYSDTGVSLGTPLTVNRATGAVAILGSGTNDNALVGFVGETFATAIASNQAMTTATPMNVGSVSLTAGDWDVSGYVQFTPSAAPTMLACGINVTSAALPAGNTQYSVQQLALAFTSGAVQVLGTGRTRISLAATTSVYLVAQGTFASGTLNAQGYINARRRR